MKYLFDTNIFIRSKNELPADVWPTFWTRIAELIRSGKIFSSIKVRDEINRGNDELTEWITENAIPSFFISVDNEIIDKYKETQNWAMRSPVFNSIAKNDYAKWPMPIL